MPKQTYALERDGEKRLEISWKTGWKNFQVLLDDQVVATVEDRNELDGGKTVNLPDKSKLFIKLKTSFFSSGIILEHNDVPIPGSLEDPYQNLKNIYGFLYLMAVFEIFIGATAAFSGFEPLVNMGIGPITIVLGVVIGLLGFWLSKKSYVALGLFMLVYAADTVYSMTIALESSPMDILMRFIIFYYVGMGFKVLKSVKQQDLEDGQIKKLS